MWRRRSSELAKVVACATLLAFASLSPAAAARLQYDQIREYFGPGQALPAYADFDREYASVRAAAPQPVKPVDGAAVRGEMLRALAVEEVRERFERMASGMALGLLTGVADANPIAHAIVARQAAQASEKLEQREFAASQARMERASAEINARSVQQTLRAIPALQRISIWDDAVRIDNPIDGTAVIYRPGEYIALDTEHRQYRVVSGAPPTENCTALPAYTIDATTPRTLGDLPVDEYSISSRLSDNTVASVSSTMIVDVWKSTLPAGLLSVAQAAGCGPLPVDRLVIYAAQQSHISNPNLRAMELESVLMRGHIRTLTQDDAALFAPPSDYQRVG